MNESMHLKGLMSRQWARPLLTGITVLGMVGLAGCGSDSDTAADPEAAANMASSCGGTEADWDTLIKDAKEEGTVTVAGPPSPEVNDALPEAFKDTFGIDVEYIAGSSGETAQKITSEREAGIYSLDAFLAGGNTMSTVIYGSDWLAPLKDELVSPKLAEPATWHAGDVQGTPFVDEPNFNSVAKISIQGQAQFIVNTDIVDDDAINGWGDLLDPEWKGKIVAMDPTTGSGLGFNVAIMLMNEFGRDFVNDLYNGQDVILQTDDRQAADGVAKGQYAVAIGVSEANGGLGQLVDDGLPVRVIGAPDDALPMVSAGYGELGLMAKAAHPAAAKLFANWLLCPDGNTVWNEANKYQSSRQDVEVEVPEYIKADTEKPYWDTYKWSLLTSDETNVILDQLNEDLK